MNNINSQINDLNNEKINFKLQKRLYSRNNSRTATILRRRPNVYDQVLMSQSNRWRGQMMMDESMMSNNLQQSNKPINDPYQYGADFNTNFNTQYNSPLTIDGRPISPDIEQQKIDAANILGKSYVKSLSSANIASATGTTNTTLPRRLGRNLPYRVLYRIRPRQRMRHGVNGIDYMPPSNLIRLFGESSVPGVRDIALSQSFLRRIFWICSFFFFGFLALRDISQLVSEYYTYPITVDVRLRDSRRLQFPAVTVCNMNIVRYSALCVANVSVIKDSMIPRDLKEKLCGMQPATTSSTIPHISSTTIMQMLSTTTTLKPPSSTHASKTTMEPTTNYRLRTTVPHSPKKKVTTTTTTTTTIPPPSNDANEGIDDINTYGVLSNYTDQTGNETNPDNENITESSTTIESSTVTDVTGSTTTTTLLPLDDIPNDIAAPILELDLPLDRPKRKVKPNINNNKNNATDNFDGGKNLTTSNNPSGENQSGSGSSRLSNKNHNSNSNNNNNEVGQNNPSKSELPGQFTENVDIELTEREEKELQENLTNWLAVIYNSNEKIAKQLGHQYEDFVLRCTIRSTNCTHETSFEQFFTPTEGNCFTFKSQNLRKTYLERIKDETSIAGVNYGLELVLNLEIMEYLTGTAQIGAIIMIHHPDELGNSASEAIFVAPQQSTYIGLKMVNISRLPKPYPEECIDHWPTALVGRLTQNASYSQQACLKICLQRTIHTRCQCQSAQLPQLELNSTLKICDTRRKITRNCVEEVMFQAEEKVSTCKCPPRCQVINYDKTVSMTKWPTREDKVTFDRGKTNINFQNLAKVTVYFQTMTCQEVRQEKAYTTAKLFSSLGGILGMYVGFSFLSLFEILEIFARRFWYIVTKKNIRFRAAVHAITAAFAMKKTKPANNNRKIDAQFNQKSKIHNNSPNIDVSKRITSQI